jgi:hypothetical protein
MATLRCPQGCRWISQFTNQVFENRDVEIFANVCNHSDRCGIEDCEYFDNTPEATEKFCRALAKRFGMPKGRKESAIYERDLRIKHGQKIPTSRYFS